MVRLQFTPYQTLYVKRQTNIIFDYELQTLKMEITLRVLLGVSIAGSAAIVFFLLLCCFKKRKTNKNIKTDPDEVIVIRENDRSADKDQNANFTNKTDETLKIVSKHSKTNSVENVEDRVEDRFSFQKYSINGEKTFQNNYYHSCPDFGRSTITRSENGYIIIAQSRPIVIDGNNVCFEYGNGSFAAKGLEIIYKYFTSRGWTNKEIAIFLKTDSTNISTIDQSICKDLEKMGVLRWTHGSAKKSRPVSVTSEEDYKILEYAKRKGGIIVTKSNSFHDWYECCPEFKEVIMKRLLKYTFKNDNILFDTGTIERDGKTLEEFLTF